MPRRRQPAHMYSVKLVTYADAAIKTQVERGEEHITQPEQLMSKLFYYGPSIAQAERNFSRAALEAYNHPLAYAVVMERDREVIIRVKAARL